jgi:hypothetical protein
LVIPYQLYKYTVNQISPVGGARTDVSRRVGSSHAMVGKAAVGQRVAIFSTGAPSGE